MLKMELIDASKGHTSQVCAWLDDSFRVGAIAIPGAVDYVAHKMKPVDIWLHA